MIRKTIGSIVIYGLIIYGIIAFGPSINFTPYVLYPAKSIEHIEIFFTIGFIAWFSYSVVRKVIKIVGFPISIVTFGVSNTVINIAVLYLIPHILSNLIVNFEMKAVSFLEILILSVILAVVGIVMKYI